MTAAKDSVEGKSSGGRTLRRRLTASQLVTAELAGALKGMEDGWFLILTYPETGAFVQFAGQKYGVLRAEAVSNEYLAPVARLTEEARDRLALLGWNAPTHDAATEDAKDAHPEFGSSNYYLDLHPPVDYLQVAMLTVRTLAGVYGVRRPGDLRYQAFTEEGRDIVFENFKVKPEEG